MTYPNCIPPTGGDGHHFEALPDECADGVIAETVYAWCFSHGWMHIGKPWCTATWVILSGATEEEALASRLEQYGEARFLHHLPGEQQIVVIEASRAARRMYGLEG
ncbi:hypothetical protein [Streptomyces sp. 5-10]|uniref:hypothetical protein n=1 Tax=Streptomyces sp. 5-10 TaxID=878925 RepID=UPI00168B7003|nr:hypothetical protein [Streptomyces sp. 5-10]MBD3004655.1 hypothetical protein [Streptomyces sp. 5-10]